MKILHLSTYTFKKNLSYPHYRLHKNLIASGHESCILSLNGDLIEDNVIYLSKNKTLPFLDLSRIMRKIYFEILKRNHKNYYYPEWNLDFVNIKQIEKVLPFEPDLIVAHWTKFAFNSKIQYEISKKYNAPIVSYMMDMAPITGGCHYAYDCNRYESGCGLCPAINSKKQKDLSWKTFKQKEHYISKTDVSLIYASEEQKKQVEKSKMWKQKNIYEMMLSVDENTFIPKDINDAKKTFGIESTKKVIFFGAASISEKRKGLSYLIEALVHLYNNNQNLRDNVLLLIAGSKLPDVDIPFEYKYLGYLSTEQELANAYQASDVFVCPSIEDSGPLMINQAIMSGRPVVSFDMGVAPDLVHTGETGYRAKLKDSFDLSRGLKYVLELNNEEWSKVSVNARKLGVEKCSIKNQVERFEKIVDFVKNK